MHCLITLEGDFDQETGTTKELFPLPSIGYPNDSRAENGRFFPQSSDTKRETLRGSTDGQMTT